MKKLLSTLFASIALSAPISAHQEIDDEWFYTPVAMGCMKLGKCTEGVYYVKPSDLDDEGKEILSHLKDLEVGVYKAIPQYFIEEYRGLYYSDKNKIFINMKYAKNPGEFLTILRHEGWHAAQDCMAGSLVNSDLMGILSHEVIPPHITKETFSRYGYDPTVVRIEREAVWAMKTPNMTVDALKACNSDTPMWETYEPPSKTWKYLYWNAWISK